MLVVALNLCRPSKMAFDQQRAGVSAERHRRGIELRSTWDHVLGLAHVGNDGFEWQAHTAGHSCERHGRAHHFQESAARYGIDPLGSAFREFAVQRLLERGAAGKLFEAAPVFRAGLVVRLVDLRAERVEIQFAFLRGTNVFSPRAAVLFFYLHRLHITHKFPQSSPVTRAATGDVFHAAHTVFLRQHRAQVDLISEALSLDHYWVRACGLLVAHIEYLIARAKVLLGRAMAAQTP